MSTQKQNPIMNEEFFKHADLLLRDRVTVNRYEHSLSVSQMAALLAEIYGVDIMYARIAGLLHDWDKCLSTSTLRSIAKKYTDVPASVRKHNAPTLHSFTAPWSLTQEFGELPQEILQAVESHTTGNIRMSDLDKVIFIADILEPGRDFPDIKDLREMIGTASLDDLFFQTYKRTVLYLITDDKMVHPNTFKVYNALIKQRRELLKADLSHDEDYLSEIDVKMPRGFKGLINDLHDEEDDVDEIDDALQQEDKEEVSYIMISQTESLSKDDAVAQVDHADQGEPVSIPAEKKPQDAHEIASAPRQDDSKNTLQEKSPILYGVSRQEKKAIDQSETLAQTSGKGKKKESTPLNDFLKQEDTKQTLQPQTNSLHRLGRLEDALHAVSQVKKKEETAPKKDVQTSTKGHPRLGKLEDFLKQEQPVKPLNKDAEEKLEKKKEAPVKKTSIGDKSTQKQVKANKKSSNIIQDKPQDEVQEIPADSGVHKSQAAQQDHVSTKNEPVEKAEDHQKKRAVDVVAVVEEAPVATQKQEVQDPLSAARKKVAKQIRENAEEESAENVTNEGADVDANVAADSEKKEAKKSSKKTAKKAKDASSADEKKPSKQKESEEEKLEVIETFLNDDGTFQSPRALTIPNDSERPTLLNKIRRAKKSNDAKKESASKKKETGKKKSNAKKKDASKGATDSKKKD